MGSQVPSAKKLDERQIRWAVYRRIQEIKGNAIPVTAKKPQSSESHENIQRYVLVKFPLKAAKSQIKHKHRDFTHSWRLHNNNNFYLNVTEWLASRVGTKCSKPIEQMSKEELNVFRKNFCASARSKDGTLSVYKSSSMKSIWEPLLIASYARCRSVFYYLWPA